MDKFPIHWQRIGIFAGIAILMLVVIEFNARLDELNRLTEETIHARAEATQAKQTQTALLTLEAYAGSDAAVEDQARGEKRMVQEGDIPVVPFGGGNSPPTPTPTPMPTPTPQPNWQVWWDLFFKK